MTYTIYGHCNELTAEQCAHADRVIGSGMIEHVFDDVVAFHDLELEDVAAARALMAEYGMTVDAELYEEHTDGCYCELVEVTDPDTLDTANKAAVKAAESEEPMKRKQRFTSADTSINSSKLPRGYKYAGIPAGAVVLDYGCGKHVEHLQRTATDRGWTWYGFDPFNRTETENRPAVDVIGAHAADYVLCCNVLNVIDDSEAVDDVIRAAVSACKVAAVFTVYEGNRTGTGKQTGRDSWQRNERRAAYVDRMRAAGYNVTRRGEYLIVRP